MNADMDGAEYGDEADQQQEGVVERTGDEMHVQNHDGSGMQ